MLRDCGILPLMPKRLGKTDTQTKISTSEISRVMAAMGRKGGKIGGKRRLVTMTPEERQESARRAVQARWAKRKD